MTTRGSAIGCWLAGAAPVPEPRLRGAATADVAIVGGGFTGLWTVIRLLETQLTCGSSSWRWR